MGNDLNFHLNNKVNIAYLFDVDGVLSDPKEKKVTHPELFQQVISRLQKSEPLGLNTGCSTEWLLDRFINPLVDRINDKSILQNFFVVGEKGGTWITFDNEGVMHHGREKELVMLEELINESKKLIEEKYHDSMFFDETKETMLSIEMHDGFDIETFHQRQTTLVEDLTQLLKKYSFKNTYNIDPTTIATDVESPKVGKALGADRFLQFLLDNDIAPVEFITFGDSKSDFEMADELEKRGQKVKMIYVGDTMKLGKFEKEYPIEYI